MRISSPQRIVTTVAALGLMGALVGAAVVAHASPSHPAAATPTAATTRTAGVPGILTHDDGLRYVRIADRFTVFGPCDRRDYSTLGMMNCADIQVLDTQKQVDVLQQKRFRNAQSTQERKAYLKDDAAWLKARDAEALKGASSGGTIDSINYPLTILHLNQVRLTELG